MKDSMLLQKIMLMTWLKIISLGTQGLMVPILVKEF
jgi:hypothetical protein